MRTLILFFLESIIFPSVLILQRIYPKIDMNHMITVSNNIEGKGETEDNKYRIQKAGAYKNRGLLPIDHGE